MEGVGARFGRSSNRYGPAPVFTGPVRKWKKKWVQASPSTSNNQSHQTPPNGAANGTNGSSHLLFYKWTPITPSRNKDNNSNSNSDSNNGNADSKISVKDDSFAVEEPPKRKFKYIPAILLEEQKNESPEQSDDEVKPIEIDSTTEVTASKNDTSVEKPDINDIPMDESESQVIEDEPVERRDLNESPLDLSLGLKGHDIDENESNDKAEDS